MKFTSLIILIIFSTHVSAEISHKTCEVTSYWTMSPINVNKNYPDDWARYSMYSDQFLKSGYKGIGTKDFNSLKDGALFTQMITTYGRNHRSILREKLYFAYTVISLREKDSTRKDGYVLKAEAHSDANSNYSSEPEDAINESILEAIRNLPPCKIVSSRQIGAEKQ
jgi:hypothetical protein